MAGGLNSVTQPKHIITSITKDVVGLSNPITGRWCWIHFRYECSFKNKAIQKWGVWFCYFIIPVHFFLFIHLQVTCTWMSRVFARKQEKHLQHSSKLHSHLQYVQLRHEADISFLNQYSFNQSYDYKIHNKIK